MDRNCCCCSPRPITVMGWDRDLMTPSLGSANLPKHSLFTGRNTKLQNDKKVSNFLFSYFKWIGFMNLQFRKFSNYGEGTPLPRNPSPSHKQFIQKGAFRYFHFHNYGTPSCTSYIASPPIYWSFVPFHRDSWRHSDDWTDDNSWHSRPHNETSKLHRSNSRMVQIAMTSTESSKNRNWFGSGQRPI